MFVDFKFIFIVIKDFKLRVQNSLHPYKLYDFLKRGVCTAEGFLVGKVNVHDPKSLRSCLSPPLTNLVDSLGFLDCENIKVEVEKSL